MLSPVSRVSRLCSAGVMAAVLAAATIACGSSTNAVVDPVSPTTPSATTPSAPPAPSLNLTGSWSGTIGTVDPIKVAWTATQSGSAVSGPFTLTILDDNNKPFTVTGTFGGTLTGSALAGTFTVAAGGVSGFPNCSFKGTGTSTADASSIAGTFAFTFVSCAGFVDQPTQSDLVSLRKQ